jgi:hypothetical protein
MKKMTQAELDQALEQHSLWLESGGAQDAHDIQGARADLSYTNLSHAYLSHANLSGANLSGANLSGAWLFYTNLTRAQISADTRLHQCSDFRYVTCSPEALPWLILHPKWPEWKSTVTVVEDKEDSQK